MYGMTLAVGFLTGSFSLLGALVPAWIERQRRREEREAQIRSQTVAERAAANERRRPVLHEITFRLGELQRGLTEAAEAKLRGANLDALPGSHVGPPGPVSRPFGQALAALEAIKVNRDRGLSLLGADGLSRVERVLGVAAAGLRSVDEAATTEETIAGRRDALTTLESEAQVFRQYVAASEEPALERSTR